MSNVPSFMNTETRNQKSEGLHTFSTRKIIDVINDEDATVAPAVKKSLSQIEAVIDQVVSVMEKGGRLFYFGAGTSGRLGVLDASECPPTFGVSSDLVRGIIAGGDRALRHPIENAEDSRDAGAEDVKRYVEKGDMVIGIASSGRTPYVLGAMEEAESLGIPTGCIACNTNTELAKMVTFPIEVLVGPEVVTGSTRMKAGTAQKMVLNMISTAAMIKLGKVYNNLMVNVQASNEKLRKRTVSIIQELTGVEAQVASRYSTQAGGDARVATLMILLNTDAETAKALLDKNNGHFPRTLEGIQ